MSGVDVDAILAGLNRPAESNGHAPTAVALEAPMLALPEELWTARPELAHVHQAARARLVAPEAVLGAVLARVAAICPHTLELPALVGAPVGLTFFAALVGPPESGKSAAAAIAAELLPAPPSVADLLPAGSGEGMVEVLFELVEEADENGKTRRVKRQTRNAAIFHIDEGAVLAELGGRRGSTLLSTLRAAWTHGTLGSTNASVETRRILDGRAYAFGVTLGLQPEICGPLLADVVAGTPQRFIWLTAVDRCAPDVAPPWPGALDWQPPAVADLEPRLVTRGGWHRHRLDVAETIAAEVRGERLAVLRGELERAPADAHAVLGRLKVAALLALLDGRADVDDGDWHLAHLVATGSRRVRARVEATLDGVARRKEQASVERVARREVHVDETREQRALVSASRSVGNVAVRHGRAKEHDGGGCSRRCFTQAIGSKYRALVTVDDAIEAAERAGWITAADDRWLAGDSRPA